MKSMNLLQEKNQLEEMMRARIRMQGDQSHHLETVLEHKGISWINHSMATTVDMTWFALRDIPGPALLIIGGIDRSNDHEKLAELIAQKVYGVICIGSTPWKYFEAFRLHTQLLVQAVNLEEAVHFSFLLARGEIKTVLFSPSCPSYDAFDNYKNRGDAFRRLVLEKKSNL
jgi:UDP-N-acetylmuramoylalanine--D-glutamate ligase